MISKSKRHIDVKLAYERYETLNFGCSVICCETLGQYDLECECGKIWHTDCFEKYTKCKVDAYLTAPHKLKICLCCKTRSFRQ